MIVVSDATPINVLIRIEQIEILPILFGAVAIPPAVEHELSHSATPVEVRAWLEKIPAWFSIRTPKWNETGIRSQHRGERQAIALAMEVKADFLLMDERRPRRIAMEAGLHVIGTLGILERAAEQELVNLAQAVQRLREINFYASERLLAQMLQRHRDRGRPSEPNQGPK